MQVSSSPSASGRQSCVGDVVASAAMHSESAQVTARRGWARVRGAPIACVVLIQVLVDLCVLAACLTVAYGLRSWFTQWFPSDLAPSLWRGLMAPIALMPLGFFLARLYPGYGMRGVERMRRRLIVVLAATAVAMAVDYLVLHGQWSRGILLMSFAMMALVIPVTDALLREILVRWGWWGMPVAIVGSGATAKRVVSTLLAHPHLGYRPEIVYDVVGTAGASLGGLPVVTDPLDARRALGGNAVAVVVLDDPAALAQVSRLPFYRVVLVPQYLGLQTLWVDALDLGGVLGLEVRQNLLLRRNRLIKGAMDRMLVVPFMLLATPLILLFALLIKCVDRGPAFYSQVREGVGGREIRIWKLRSMFVNSQEMLKVHLAADPLAKEEWERFMKLRRDPRILPIIGAFIRKTSIDELPQLWNVMCGDLSLVGPRPFPDYHLEKFSPEFRALRCSVMPGVTGLWQVSDRSEGDLSRQEQLDSYYIRNWSPWMDLQLLARTVWTLLFKRGGAC